MNFYGGIRIVETSHAIMNREDWSRVRSPGRARRRRVQGHRQNIVTTVEPACYQINGVLYAHPTLYAEIKKRVNVSRPEFGTAFPDIRGFRI